MKAKIFLICICLMFVAISGVNATENIAILENGTNITLNETHNVSDVINIDGDEYYVENKIVEPSEIIGYEDGSKIITKEAYNETKIADIPLTKHGEHKSIFGNFRPTYGINNTYTFNMFTVSPDHPYGFYSICFYYSVGGSSGAGVPNIYFDFNLDENNNVKYVPFENKRYSVSIAYISIGGQAKKYWVTALWVSITEDGDVTLVYDLTGDEINQNLAYYDYFNVRTCVWLECTEHEEEFYYEQVPIYSEERIFYQLKKVERSSNNTIIQEKKVTPNVTSNLTPDDVKPPVPDDLVSSKNNTDNSTAIAGASMKNTGMPIIAILLVLISVFGLCFNRKENNK